MIERFGITAGGDPVEVIRIQNADISTSILTYGAILQDLRLVDGVPLTLGSPELAAYEGPMASFGSLMGPVVNRIRDGRARIDGHEFEFERNFQGKHCLHSGSPGMQHQIWNIAEAGRDFVTLKRHLPHGLGGFPGDRWVTADYRLSGPALSLTVTAETDRPTIFAPANHSYWALDGKRGFAGHQLQIPADHITETDAELIPTGVLTPVAAAGLDHRTARLLAGDASQFYDMNFCLSPAPMDCRPIATLTGSTGRRLTLSSTLPGLQIYDCGTIHAEGFTNHHGAGYGPYAGIALEAQHWPGAAEHAHFPDITLRPDAPYRQETRWSFS